MTKYLPFQHQTVDEVTLFQMLKTVSRSFYLSIRILPSRARWPIAIAYLLARAADSIADSPSIDRSKKLALLQQFTQQLNNADKNSIANLTENALNLIYEPSEQQLLSNLSMILQSYYSLSTVENNSINNVVTTLISGMQQDMETFTNHQRITCIESDKDLDTYIYRVAGCVGEFWTEILTLHYAKDLDWNREKQIQLGINYGKALQLTNILRDIPKDAELGRCYLPLESLESHKLTTNNYLSANNQHSRNHVIKKYLRLSLSYFNDAENYLLATPVRQWRMRMAALWPIAIGLKTLALLNQNLADSNQLKPVKVQRNWVYRLLLISPLLLISNKTTIRYLKKLKQSIDTPAL